ncbi:MAG: hypothetical protein QOF84_5166 [Streptomyces sp.]|nr:hypothetical protein [Streptomyces sp.]
MPEPLISIAIEPSGRVSAKGADALAATLLRRAGFTEVNDWHGLRHRLPLSTPAEEQADVALNAAAMLHAARYRVDLDPALGPGPAVTTTPTDPHGRYIVGRAVLGLTDQINAATSAGQTAEVLDQFLNPTDGVLIRLQEAIEAAAEKCTDFDSDFDSGKNFELSDRFTAASELLTQIGHDLDGAALDFHALDPTPLSPRPSWQAKAAAYYATAVTRTARTTTTTPTDTRRTTSTDAAAQPGPQPTRRTR